MIEITMDLLESPIQIFAHQVNCKGVMGAGLAKKLRDKYDGLYEEYKNFIKGQADGSPLGKAMIYLDWNCHNPNKSRIIMSIFGQDGYGLGPCHTNYDAVKSGFKDGIQQLRVDLRIKSWVQITIGIPTYFGCGLAGGNWGKMMDVLENIEQEENVFFVLHHFYLTERKI